VSECFSFPIATVHRAVDLAAEASARCDRFSVPVNGALDPAPIVESFGCLRIRPGWKLTAFLQGNLDGDSRVVALPADFEPGSADDVRFSLARLRGQVEEPYARYSSDWGICVPLASLLRFMKVVDGDGTPWSYLCASLAVRQLLDVGVFGRFVHEHDWAEHRAVGSLADCFPNSRLRGDCTSPALQPPEVTTDDSRVAVRFYTYRPPGALPEGVWLHEDGYSEGSYEPALARLIVAKGRPRKYFL
jgi:hypothetical protein